MTTEFVDAVLKKFEDLKIIDVRKENVSPEEKEFIGNELYKIFEKYYKD